MYYICSVISRHERATQPRLRDLKALVGDYDDVLNY